MTLCKEKSTNSESEGDDERSFEDKILVPKPPQNCATCGNPVDGLYCRSCAFVRKCLNEGRKKKGELWKSKQLKIDIGRSSFVTNRLREKLLNISRLVTNIESLKNNPTPDYVFKSPSSFPIPVMDSNWFFEESDTSLSHLDNSLPKFETFSYHTEETRSGSNTTHANNSLPEYDSFLFEVVPDQGGLIGIVISDNSNNPLLELPEFESFHFDLDPSFPRPPLELPDVEISLIIETDAPVINNFDELNDDECFDPEGDEINVEDDDSFIFVIQTFLSFLTYPEVSPLLSSTKNEDTIYVPDIST
ncbi:hypothetical protein Tco_0347667 [Tanacetum coccineum]